MRSIRRRVVAVVVATGAVALAAPVSGASAQLPFPGLGTTVVAIGGQQIGSAVCASTNRPEAGGNNGTTSAQACSSVASWQGAHVGQIGGEPFGNNIVNSPFTEAYVTSGSITQIGP
jgi:hypothetical protein